jgi:hypothetical protein
MANKLDLQAIRKRAEASTEAGPGSSDDTRFMVAARKDVPALIAEVERLHGVVGTLVSQLELIEIHTEELGLMLVKEAIEYGEEELRG